MTPRLAGRPSADASMPSRFRRRSATLFLLASAISCAPTEPAPPNHLGPSNLDPSLDTTGSLIAFTHRSARPVIPGRANDGVYVADLGQNSVALVAADAAFPSLDHTGTMLLYTMPGMSLHVRDLRSGTERLLSAPGELARHGTWAPDGSRLAFDRYDEARNRFVLAVMRADGSGAVRVTPHADSTGEERFPTWSPDSREIAYNVYVRGNGGRAAVSDPDIWIVSLASGEVRRIGSGGPPRWSPDGRWIAFVAHSADGRTSELRIVRPDGSGLRTLLQSRSCSDGCAISRPDWLPDGGTVVFSRQFAAGADFWLVDTTATNLRTLCSCMPVPGTGQFR